MRFARQRGDLFDVDLSCQSSPHYFDCHVVFGSFLYRSFVHLLYRSRGQDRDREGDFAGAVSDHAAAVVVWDYVAFDDCGFSDGVLVALLLWFLGDDVDASEARVCARAGWVPSFMSLDFLAFTERGDSLQFDAATDLE